MNKVSILAIALSICSTPLSAQATNRSESGLQPISSGGGKGVDVAVDLVSGTLGFGLQISKLVMPHVGIRAGGTYFSLNKRINQSDVDYDAKLKVGAISGLVDFFPRSRGAFHLTGGLLSNRTKVDATGVCTNGSIELNNRSYTCAQVGTLTGLIEFPSVSPYVGLGFGTPAKGSRVHFVLDLGGAFGTPSLTLTSSNSSNAQLAADLKAQRDKTQTDVNKYAKIYPVIQSGLGIRF